MPSVSANSSASRRGLTRVAEQYWIESRRPLASLVFLAPLLAVYELGVLVFGVRSGADLWMRSILDFLGFGQHFVLPILTICILLAWHYLSREPWWLSGGIISAMAAESLVLALCLRMLLLVQQTIFDAFAGPVLVGIGSCLRDAVGYLGAGIYEELLFRLILLGSCLWALRRLRLGHGASIVLALLVTSLLFAAAHYVGRHGDEFRWFSFIFRFAAGVFFSVVFVYRGFGIAAGSHAAYDIVVWLLWG